MKKYMYTLVFAAIFIVTSATIASAKSKARSTASAGLPSYKCYIETRDLKNYGHVLSYHEVSLDLSDGNSHTIGEVNGETYIASVDTQLLNISVSGGASIGWGLSYGQAEMGGITEDCKAGICDPQKGLAKTISRVGCKKEAP